MKSDLGCDQHLFALGRFALQPPPDHRLALATVVTWNPGGIDVRRVDHVAARVDEGVEDAKTGCFVRSPAEYITAKDERSDRKMAVAWPCAWESSCLRPSRSVHQLFVKFSDTPRHVGGFDSGARMDALITFWSHALAAACFAALMIWRLGEAARNPGQRLLAGAFAITACWAWIGAVAPTDPLFGFAESARNLVWISVLYSLSAAGEEREHGLKLVYGAIAAVIGLQLIGGALQLFSPSDTLPRLA